MNLKPFLSHVHPETQFVIGNLHFIYNTILQLSTQTMKVELGIKRIQEVYFWIDSNTFNFHLK